MRFLADEEEEPHLDDHKQGNKERLLGPQIAMEMNNSDDDRDIDIESDDGNDSDTRSQNRGSINGTQHYSQAEKRAHHNALERKRRDHIKDSFTSLKDSVPSLQGEKGASRAQILRKAAEFIQFMRRKNQSHQINIEDLKRQNNMLETQIRQLERQRDSFGVPEDELNAQMELHHQQNAQNGEGDSSESEEESVDEDVDEHLDVRQVAKKQKTTYAV